jgi:small subunit ribosomal protein S20
MFAPGESFHPALRPKSATYQGHQDEKTHLFELPLWAARPFPGRASRLKTNKGRIRVANIKSQIKRIKTNEKAHQRNKAVKSELRTHVRKFREAVEAGNVEEATTALRVASRKLDKAVSKGVIHKNQAANRKSAIAKRLADLQSA